MASKDVDKTINLTLQHSFPLPKKGSSNLTLQECQPVGQSFTDNIFHLTESTKADNKDYINQQTTASKKAIYILSWFHQTSLNTNYHGKLFNVELIHKI